MAEQPRSRDDIVDRHLARAWRAFAPAPGLSDQVRARLTSSTAATMGAVGLAVAGNARPPGAWASLQASGKLGALVGAGLLGVGLLSGYLIRDAIDTPPAAISTSSGQSPARPPPALTPLPAAAPVPDSEPAPPPAASSASHAVATALPRVAAAPLARERSNPPPAPPSSTRTSLAEQPASDELALLRRAERAVRAGNAALALALIAELEERYPRSGLLEERRAMELMAHCGAGATDARPRARRFLNEHPQSVYAGRIRKMCDDPSEPSTPAR